ncbi:Vacuolar protein sorting-associated protein 8 [Myotisia sp. PD_48]|nr:Vacuolar protein sorting-associated protein 8 [Myotisia sp. PD_48]
MSSTIEGSDDESRKDELDSRQNDEDDWGQFTSAEGNGDIAVDDEHTDKQHEATQPLQPADAQLLDENDDDDDAVSLANSEEASIDVGEDIGQPGEAVQVYPNGDGAGSLDESIPDDLPSNQISGSLRSSPSSAYAHRGSISNLSPVPHRPFDHRFQSRLSLSLPAVPRPGSPSLSLIHSRNSSLTSQFRYDNTHTPDFLEESALAPWEVVRWTKLKKIAGQVFSEVGKRSFGRPTCIAVSTSIVLGTSKGIILVFDYQQNLKCLIGPGTKAATSGAVTSLAISADHSTVASGHVDGNIYTWELARPARPFLSIAPIPINDIESRRSDGHIAGAPVIHLGFLGTRHTALVSADDQGMAFSHLATRGMGSVGRVVRTSRILGRYPDYSPSAPPRKPSSVLAFSPLPLGNVEQPTDHLGLVAMLTPYLLVIVSTTPVARTQYKAGRPKELVAHSTLTATLAWFPAIKLKAKNSEVSKTKLVYCWSNVLTILDVDEVKSTHPGDRDKPAKLQFKPRCRWRALEAIVAVQWISRSVLAVMTITQQLLILEDNTLRVTDSSDLIHRHIYHADLFSKHLHSLVEQLNEEEQDQSMHGVVADAFHMSFRAYKGRLFLLGFSDICVGSLSNWADRLLALVESGDFIGAIRLATEFYIGQSEKLTVGLPEEDELRHGLVEEKLLEMMSASLRFAFGKNEDSTVERLEETQLSELADVCIAACDSMKNYDFLFEDVYSWYEEFDSEALFLDALEPYIVSGSIRALPPTAVKSLITHFATTHTANRLEEIICLLETETMDINQVTGLCKRLNLYDAYVYVWNRCLHDYISPLHELLKLALNAKKPSSDEQGNGTTVITAQDYGNAMKMFPYLSYVLTSRIYPTGDDMDYAEALAAKSDIYQFLFSGKASIDTKSAKGKKTVPSPYANLRIMLELDTPGFMSMLNEAFEDSFLNDPVDQWSSGEQVKPGEGLSMNRQYLIRILLEVMDPSTSDFDPTDTIYLDMFIARNLPKYPQFILLSGSTLHQVLERLCNYPEVEMLTDCQLSAEYLLSTYHPPDMQHLIPLFQQANFFRILKSTYRAEKQYSDLLRAFLGDSDDQRQIFICIRDCLRASSELTSKQRQDFVNTMKECAREIAEIDVPETARTIQAVAATIAPDLHNEFLRALESDPRGQYQYLNAILEPENKLRFETVSTIQLDHELVELYVQLMCQYNPSHVADFVDMTKVGDLQLEAVLPAIEQGGIVDAAVILLARQGEVSNAMERLTRHLHTLEAGLTGILQNAEETPDSASTAEAVTDLISSVEKYTKVGIWLCQEQSKLARRVHQGGKFNKRGSSVFDQPLTSDENLWLALIEGVVKTAQSVSPLLSRGIPQNEEWAKQPWQIEAADERNGDKDTNIRPGHISSSFRSLVQLVFTSLLTSTTRTSQSPEGKTDASFLRILRAFLTRAASVSPSLSELRAVIGSIFSAYTYEESLLSLANTMLDKDLFVHVEAITNLRQRGWRPRGQVCELCRRRAWGPGAGAYIWEAWEQKQAGLEERTRARGLGKDGDDGNDGQPNATGSRSKGKGVAAPAVIPEPAPPSVPPPPPVLSPSAVSGSSLNEDQSLASSGEGSSQGALSQVPGVSTSPITGDPHVNTGPVLVFGCRHLYHQSCLVAELTNRGLRVVPPSQTRPFFPSSYEVFTSEGAGPRQFSCLLCI